MATIFQQAEQVQKHITTMLSSLKERNKPFTPQEIKSLQLLQKELKDSKVKLHPDKNRHCKDEADKATKILNAISEKLGNLLENPRKGATQIYWYEFGSKHNYYLKSSYFALLLTSYIFFPGLLLPTIYITSVLSLLNVANQVYIAHSLDLKNNPYYSEFENIRTHLDGSWWLASLAYSMVNLAGLLGTIYTLTLTKNIFASEFLLSTSLLLIQYFTDANNTQYFTSQAKEADNTALKWQAYIYSWDILILLARNIAMLAVQMYIPDFWFAACVISACVQFLMAWNHSCMVYNSSGSRHPYEDEVAQTAWSHAKIIAKELITQYFSLPAVIGWNFGRLIYTFLELGILQNNVNTQTGEMYSVEEVVSRIQEVTKNLTEAIQTIPSTQISESNWQKRTAVAPEETKENILDID